MVFFLILSLGLTALVLYRVRPLHVPNAVLSLLGLSIAATGQEGSFPIVLEDWGCAKAATVSNENPAVVTCETPHGLPPRTADGANWRIVMRGASDAWQPLNARWQITVLDENRFSIPLDATGFGPFDGQNVTVLRTNHEGADLFNAAFAGSKNIGTPLSDGQFQVYVQEGYASTASSLNCYGTPITRFSVSGGEATVTLQRAMFNESPGYVLAPGREIHFRHLNDPRLNSMAYAGGGQVDKPHIVSWVNGQRTELKVPVTVPDGEYGPAGTTQPQAFICPVNFFTLLFLPRHPGGYPMPQASASYYAKNGRIPADGNRLYLWVKWGKSVPRQANGAYQATVGTYAKSPEDTDVRAERFHFYHYLNPNFYANRWMRIIINNTPQHVRGANGYAVVPTDPMRSGWPHYSSPSWDFKPAAYLPNLTAFYLDNFFRNSDLSGQTAYVGPVILDKVTGEPDAYVSSITALWTDERVGDRGPGYEVGFYPPKNSRDTYEFRYSASASLKEIGFSAGESGGALTKTAATGATLMWYSPKLDEAPAFWVGIRPHMSILGVSKAGTSPIVVTLNTDPTMDDGDRVTISGVRGNDAVNQTAVPVRNVPGRFWRLGRGLVRLSVLDRVATVELDTNHELVPGQVVEVAHSRNANLGSVPMQRLYTVQSTPSPTTFTLITQSVPDGDYTANQSSVEFLYVRVFPALSIEGTSDGDYGGAGCENQRLCNGGGTLVSAEEFKGFTEVAITPFDSGSSILRKVVQHRSGSAAEQRRRRGVTAVRR